MEKGIKNMLKLKDDLEQAKREIADGVRDWLDLKDAYRSLKDENNILREMLVDHITKSLDPDDRARAHANLEYSIKARKSN